MMSDAGLQFQMMLMAARLQKQADQGAVCCQAGSWKHVCGYVDCMGMHNHPRSRQASALSQFLGAAGVEPAYT